MPHDAEVNAGAFVGEKRCKTGSLAAGYYRLRTPKQSFAYTQITVCVRPNDCLSIRKRFR